MFFPPRLAHDSCGGLQPLTRPVGMEDLQLLDPRQEAGGNQSQRRRADCGNTTRSPDRMAVPGLAFLARRLARNLDTHIPSTKTPNCYFRHFLHVVSVVPGHRTLERSYHGGNGSRGPTRTARQVACPGQCRKLPCSRRRRAPRTDRAVGDGSCSQRGGARGGGYGAQGP